jgi:hypothetical protein
MMKKLMVLLLIFVVGAVAQAIVIEDFSDDLSEWTSTVILDNNGGASNIAAWQISGGALQLNTTAFDGIEQYAFIRSDLSLAVGDELRANVIVGATGSQDIGLYVGGTEPQTGVRQDYIAMYRRNNGQLFSRGFDEIAEYELAGDWTENIPITQLFIARTGENTYEAGWYNGTVRNVLVTRTPAYANDATYVGIYADVRDLGVLGSIDSLELWNPKWAAHEPSPANGSQSVGTVNVNTDTVDVTLAWQVGLDPYDETQVNPSITKHYVFMSDTPDDPNLYYVGTVSQPQPASAPDIASFTAGGLIGVTAYRWSIVEALAGYDQKVFTPGVSTLDNVDPNNIIGPTWTFTTTVGVDRRLVGEYLFENNLNDNSAEGNHGNAADPNAPTFDNAEPFNDTSGYYAVFDGIANYADLGITAFPRAEAFPYGVGGGMEEGTITCWVKPSQAGVLLSNYNDGMTTGFALSLAVNGEQIDSRINVRGESADVGTVQGRPGMTGFDMLGDGRWHMVAATWKWGETMRVYVDGAQVASVAAGTPAQFADWQRGVVLGASRTAADRDALSTFYGGFMDTLRIYNYVLTPEEIATEYYQMTGERACTDPAFAGSEFNFDNSIYSYCKVDLADFAMFAEAWMSDGLFDGL